MSVYQLSLKSDRPPALISIEAQTLGETQMHPRPRNLFRYGVEWSYGPLRQAQVVIHHHPSNTAPSDGENWPGPGITSASAEVIVTALYLYPLAIA
jgi:hypothetical protein